MMMMIMLMIELVDVDKFKTYIVDTHDKYIHIKQYINHYT